MTLRSKQRGKSSTLDILGGGATPARRPAKWSEHHKRLTQLREHFLRGKDAQSRSAKEEQSWFSEHMADAATDSYDRDCALALLSSTQNALYEIEQALKRIKDGSFGICEITGKPIELERLRAIPWTRFSVEAQSQIEARKGAARVQLGQLGTCLKAGDDSDEDETESAAGPEHEREAA